MNCQVWKILSNVYGAYVTTERLVVLLVPDLLRILNQEYNLSATELKPFGPVWRVFSAKGRFALKKTDPSAEGLVHTAEMLSKIHEAGFSSLISPEISKKKLPYFEFNNHYYQLFQWRQGSHPSFTEPDSIKKSACLFAGLHRISSLALNGEEDEECKIKDLIAGLEQRTAFLENTIAFLKEQSQMNRIDRGLIGWSDYFLAQARYGLSGLRQVVRNPRSSLLTGFCHNDPAPRNIIVENGQWFLIDFQLSARDLLVTEISKLAGRILQANDWDPSIFDMVINAYHRERPITDWEKSALPYLLCFPQPFWRICRQRFAEKLKWSQRRFADKFWKTTNEEPQRLLFLKTILPEL